MKTDNMMYEGFEHGLNTDQYMVKSKSEEKKSEEQKPENSYKIHNDWQGVLDFGCR